MMTVVFETPRFRVHITGNVAWIENREDSAWVFRSQLMIPVSAESLDAVDNTSTVRAAVLDFEESRAGDKSLRSALMGYREAPPVQILPSVRERSSRSFNVRPARPVRSVRKYWSPQPLRPPLAAKVL
jgi:hypothetical protein